MYAVLAVVCLSTSAVLVRWAAPLSPFEITFWRMAVAAITVWLIGRLRGGVYRFTRSDLPRFLLFGLVAALHFFSYIASLSYTTIAHSLTLVYTAPVFVAVFAALLLRESIPQTRYLGIAVVITGIAILTGFEPALVERVLLGDALALASAIAFGFYSIIGRAQRSRYPLFTYAFGTYGAAAIWLLPAAVLTWTGAYGLANVICLLALGIFPLGIGHTLYNAALRHLHPTYVNIIATQEVTGGVLLGLLLLGEVPSPTAIVGAGVTLVGVILVLR